MSDLFRNLFGLIWDALCLIASWVVLLAIGAFVMGLPAGVIVWLVHTGWIG